MKLKKQNLMIFNILILMFLSSFSTFSHAVDEKACAIWLCLPSGFPSGCSDAKSAMVDRIKHFKPPLPDLSSCMIDANGESASDEEVEESGVSEQNGYGAWITGYSYCAEYSYRTYGKNKGQKYCTRTEVYEPKIIKDTKCTRGKEHRENGGWKWNNAKSTPAYCTKTLKYVDVYVDGKPSGDTMWYDDEGNTY